MTRIALACIVLTLTSCATCRPRAEIIPRCPDGYHCPVGNRPDGVLIKLKCEV